MFDVYDLKILPDILKHFKVEKIIIDGLSNKKIIDEILSYDAHITAIDYNNPHGFDFDIIEDDSLNVLVNLSDYDAIFINNDPNWFTVFNELNTIKNTNEKFPLVFICNNKFPYKRRDSYSNPDNIPDEFRHDFSKEFQLNVNGNRIVLCDDYYHANAENTNKNGVLTAIEDFLEDNSEICIMDIQLIEEITILYPKSTISQIRIDKIMGDIENKKIDDINLNSIKTENQFLLSWLSKNNKFISDLEEIDNLKIEITEQNKIIDQFKNKINDYDNEMLYKNSRVNNVESQLDLKDSQIKNLESKLINRNVEIENLNNRIITLETNLNEEKLNFEKSEEILQSKIKDKIKVIDNVLDSFENRIDDLIEDNKDTSNKLKNTNSKLKLTEKILKDSQKSFDSLRRDNNQLSSELEDSQKSFDSLRRDNNQLSSELEDSQKSFDFLKERNNQLNSKLDSSKYCISCFKEEISNNKLEIQYMRKNSLVRGILSPLSFLILLLKSQPNDVFLNIKLYKSLKNSKCFDIGYYLKNNIDLLNSNWCNYFSPELHYVCIGFNEGRKFNKKYFNRNSKKELLEYLSKCGEM